MLTQGMLDQVQGHMREHPDHTIDLLVNEHNNGAEYKCRECDVYLAWQVPDTSALAEKQRQELFLAIPVRNGSDSDSVDSILLEKGFEVVTPDNFEEAKAAVISELQAGRFLSLLGF